MTSFYVDKRLNKIWSNNLGDGVVILVEEIKKGDYRVQLLNKPDNLENKDEVDRLAKLKDCKIKYSVPFDQIENWMNLLKEQESSPKSFLH